MVLERSEFMEEDNVFPENPTRFLLDFSNVIFILFPKLILSMALQVGQSVFLYLTTMIIIRPSHETEKQKIP